jgi:hypothetical protein
LLKSRSAVIRKEGRVPEPKCNNARLGHAARKLKKGLHLRGASHEESLTA